jgi:hypothetical protein
MMRFDWALIESTIIERAVVGLDSTIEYAKERAKHHAPVRKIFKGGRRGRVEFPRGGHPANRDAGTPASRPVRIRNEAQMESFRRSRPRMRRIDIPDEGPRIGHANSFMPVFRSKGVTATADARRYSSASKRLEEVEWQSQVQGGRVVNAGRGSARALASARGMWEIRSGRAAHRDVRYSLNEQTGRVRRLEGPERLGGRLRAGIESVPAAPESSSLWMGYVVSPVSYSRWQEFGTGRHRAQPFLRPALYESRRQLRDRVRRAIRLGR